MTATAIRGCSAGANATSHVCDVLFPVWAVPVLAATVVPGMATRVAVPLVTTPTMRSRMVEATEGEIARSHCLGSNFSIC